jgi:DNA-binding MarR family transcriptional regulator
MASTKLEQELNLAEPIASLNHEALLGIVRTASLILKLSDRFFSDFGITDAQFNILMLLKHSGGKKVSQQDLSDRLVVNKSNIVGLVDRLERAGIVKRKTDPADRRSNQIVFTTKGLKLMDRVEGEYYARIDEVMDALNADEKNALVSALDDLRERIRGLGGKRSESKL